MIFIRNNKLPKVVMHCRTLLRNILFWSCFISQLGQKRPWILYENVLIET